MKRDRLFGNAFMRLAAYVVVAFVYVGDAWGGINTSPMNPAFKEWQRNRIAAAQYVTTTNNVRMRRLLSASNRETFTLGYVPSIVDYSYLRDINYQNVYQAGGVSLPRKFDQRDRKKVSSVKNQNPFGTCWSHATMGSLEHLLLMRNEETKDFSEKHLANTHGWDWGFTQGGNGTLATAYLTRWGGPIAESEDPYPTSYQVSASPTGTPLGHVQNVKILSPMANASDVDEIKKTVMEHGGVYVGYTHVWNALSANGKVSDSGKNFYWNGDEYLMGKDDGGHAVLIIGWDDDYSKDNFKDRPAGNGAFIVKNSWGTSFGEDGYFYVSYYDATFGRGELFSFLNLESVDNYSSVYQYDPLGHISDCGYGSATCWGANMFAALDSESLAAVGFYANVQNTKYEITIYTGCTANKPISGTKQLVQAGTSDFCGYVTIPLVSDAKVTKGALFSIVIKLTTPGYLYPLAYEGYYSYVYKGKTYWTPTSGAMAAEGQSFISSDGEDWKDFTKAIHPTANFCLKAYTKSATAAKPTLSSIVISGESSLASGKTAQFSCEATYTDGSKKNVSPTWSITEGRNYATISSSGLVTAKNVTEQQKVTVKASYKEGSVTKDAIWGLYVTAGAPAKPEGVTATEGTESSCIRVTWTAPNGATEYAVYRATANNSQNAQYLNKVTVAKFNDTSAVPGIDYWYFVKAKNASDSSDFSAGAKGWRKFSPPDGVTATDDLADKVTVKWDAVDGAKAYRVYRATSINGVPSPISGWITAMSFDDTTVTAGVTYYYYVSAAVDANGNRPSDYSIVEDGKRAAPVMASKLTISGPATIESGKSASYTASVEYSDQSGPKDVTTKCTWTKLGSSADWSGTSRMLTAKTVTSNQKVQLIAFYVENAKTIACTNDVTITPVAATSLSAPSGLKVMSQTAAGVALSWNAVTGAGSYAVYRAVSGQAERIGTSTTTSFTDKGATPGVTYSYSVSAVNSKGESARSGTVTGTVPLSAPTGVTATGSTDGVNVSWQPSAGATYYRVARATSKTGSKTDLGSWTTNKSYLDASATAGTTYYYFVRAATSSGGANASAYSESAQGVRISSGTLSSISISGQDKVAAGQIALYTCTATYSNGKSASVKASWSVSPTTAATIDGEGRLTAKSVSQNTDVTITASFTDGAVKTASKTVKILAATSTQSAHVNGITVSPRWPFAAILDIDYTLVVNPPSSKACVSVFGRDEDRGVDIAAKTLSGDGSDGSPIAAGKHRLSWNIGADYPDFHATSFSVAMNAALYTTPTYTVTYKPGANGTGSQQTATKTKDVVLTLRGATFTRTGYTQTGWATSDGGAKVYDLGGSYVANAAVTLYPFWTVKSYTLTVNPNGGTLSGTNFGASNGTSQQSVVYVTYDALNYYELGTATRTAYMFDGWWTSATGGEQVYTANGLAVTGSRYWNTSWQWQYDGNVTVYAHWKSYNLMPLRNLLTNIEKLTPDGVLSDEELNKAMTNPHYADLDGDSTTISTAEMSVFQRIQTLNTNKSLISNVISGNYSGIPETTMEELQSISDAVKALTSDRNMVTILFNGNGGTPAETTKVYSLNATYGVLPTVGYSGYTFAGWWTAASGGTQVTESSVVPTTEITLYAHWDKKTYVLTPLRNLLAGIEKLTPDGVLSDEELNKAMTNPHYADLDGDSAVISSAEMSVFRRIQALNTDKTLMSNVMSGNYSGIPDATMEELGSISDAIRELTTNR